MRKTIREKCCHNDSKEDCYDCPFREVPRITLMEKVYIFGILSLVLLGTITAFIWKGF